MEQLMLFPEDFPANHSPLPGSEKAKTMTVTSGMKCLELFQQLNRPMLLAKMLLASSAWHSTRCYLTWKIKATPQKRLLFQLAVKTPGTGVIGYGLLLTPTTVEFCEPPEKMRERANRKGYKNGSKWNSLSSQIKYGAHLFFPTPQHRDFRSGEAKRWMDPNRSRNLNDAVAFLPTPTTQDAKNNGSQSQLARKTLPLNAVAGGKLNPEWVEWLMGYPIGWTDLKD